MPTTYEPIATTTLGSAASSITFSSIASSWTDLRLVVVATGDTTARNVLLTFNSDSSTNYSYTYLLGNGSATQSSREVSAPFVNLTAATSVSNTIPGLLMCDIFSYAGSTNKTLLNTTANDNNGSGSIHSLVGLWRSTSAITTVKIANSGTSNWAAGSTATLYGIKNA